MYYEQLQNSLRDQIIEADTIALQENIIHSEAVVPPFPFEPNPRFIIFVNSFFAFFGALFYIFFRQLILKYVYSSKQIKEELDCQMVSTLSIPRLLRKANLSSSGIIDTQTLKMEFISGPIQSGK